MASQGSGSDPSSDQVGGDFQQNDAIPQFTPPQVPFPRRRHPLLVRMRPLPQELANENRREEEEASAAPEVILSGHLPTVTDVLKVRGYLGELGLPLELALAILNYADYRIKVLEKRGTSRSIQSRFDSTMHSNTSLYLLTPPIPTIPAEIDDGDVNRKNSEKSEQPTELRSVKVTFVVVSHDQGWCDSYPARRSNYDNCNSFFEVSIIRPCGSTNQASGNVVTSSEKSAMKESSQDEQPSVDSLIDTNYPTARDAQRCFSEAGYTLVNSFEQEVTWHLQSNYVASRDDRTHVIIWDSNDTARGFAKDTGSPSPEDILEESEYQSDETDGGYGDGKGFVKSLKSGDRVVIWAKARYPGWANYVKHAEVEITCDS